MSRLLLRNCVLLDPEAEREAPGRLLIDEGRIAARLDLEDDAPDDARVVDLRGGALAPGFLDLHFHGRGVFADPLGDPTGLEAALDADAEACASQGTTAFLATSVAWPAEQLAGWLTQLADRVGRHRDPEAGAELLGLHLEGPWINADAAGGQPAAGIRRFARREADDLFARAGDLLRMVTLAPELPGTAELQDELARRGSIAALGHSLAAAHVVDEAVERGACHVTHLFNAMGRIHQREPGLAGAALVDDRLSCDLICDGAHVDPRMVALAARAKRDRLLLISDRVDPPRPEGSSFGAGPLRDDGVALRAADGSLAGSRIGLATALANFRRYAGVTRLEAVAACSLRPARLLGVEAERGTLRRGARADFALLDEGDRVLETWRAGRRIYAAPPAPA